MRTKRGSPAATKKKLTAETPRPPRSSLGAHASSVPWVSNTLHAGCVRSQEPAEENPWQLAKDFRLRRTTQSAGKSRCTATFRPF